MLIDRRFGVVARWEMDTASVDLLDWQAVFHAAEECRRVCEILEAHRLLVPKRVRVDIWMRPGVAVAASVRLEHPAIEIPVNGSAGIVDAVRRAHDTAGVNRVPISVSVSGTGIIVLPDGELEAADVVWVEAMLLDTTTITVATQSDAWLPCTLSGQPQPAVHDGNAPRLERALSAASDAVASPLVAADSAYANVDGYRLDNVKYADGSAADVTPDDSGGPSR